MLGVFEMVAIISVVGIIASVVGKWLSQRELVLGNINQIEKRLQKLESLQQRVIALEAIVTDKGYDLKRQIDNLS